MTSIVKINEYLLSSPKGSRVVLVSLRAGGVGLNLTGGNHLFLLDNHWNPALEEQACDRIYRYRPTHTHTLTCTHIYTHTTSGTLPWRNRLLTGNIGRDGRTHTFQLFITDCT